MNRLEKTRREHRLYQNGVKNPSFSTTLLDKIYRSIDEKERKSGEMKFYAETRGKKQKRINIKWDKTVEKEEFGTTDVGSVCLMDRKASEKVGTQGGHWVTQRERKLHHDHHHEHVNQDVMFFSSTLSSSDPSFGLLSSSSDTESMNGLRSRVSSCFAPSRLKPVRTIVSERNVLPSNEEGLIKSKSRALKIYNNLKNIKQPISPGGKLTNFLNSLFTTGNTRKNKTTPTFGTYEDANSERKAKLGQASTCSSTSSFSRSCLSKTSPSSRDKLRNAVKRTMRFYPVNVIVDEDSRPYGHKSLYEEKDMRLMAMSIPTAWKIGKSPIKKNEEEAMDKNKRVEEATREFLKQYHQNQKKNYYVLRDFPLKSNEDEGEDEDEDDAASCSSSDLFELDHLEVIGNNRYCEELPVYETTHVSTNRAIANDLIM